MNRLGPLLLLGLFASLTAASAAPREESRPKRTRREVASKATKPETARAKSRKASAAKKSSTKKSEEAKPVGKRTRQLRRATPKVAPRPKPTARPASARPRPAPVKTPPTPPQPPAPAKPPRYAPEGVLNLPRLLREGRAAVTSSGFDTASLPLALDTNRRTFAKQTTPQVAPGQAITTPTAPWVQVVLDRPRALEAADLTVVETNVTWSLLAADSLAELEARRGSFQALVAGRTAQAGEVDPVLLKGSRPFRVFRLECRSDTAGQPVRLAQWSLWSLQELARVEIETVVPEVGLGGLLPLRANGILDGGADQNLTPDVTWEVSPPGAGEVDAFARFEPKTAGVVRIAARFQNTVSTPLEVQVLPDARPDWDVTHLERQPRLDYSNLNAAPTEGQTVIWFGHVRNYGTGDSPPVKLEWRVDGEVVKRDMLPKIPRFSQSEVLLKTKWDGFRHQVELIVDPENTVAETCEGNNRVAVANDSLAVGFWVEDSVIRYFHRHQRTLGIGANSWEDWAQRQIAARNAAAQVGATLEKPAELWRLDRIQVVGDGMLPFDLGSAETDPDRRDSTVQLMWGFPAYDPTTSPLYRDTTHAEATNPFFQDATLLERLQNTRAALPLPPIALPPFQLLPAPVRMEIVPPNPVTPVPVLDAPSAGEPLLPPAAIQPSGIRNDEQ